jgi:hypothetical protein
MSDDSFANDIDFSGFDDDGGDGDADFSPGCLVCIIFFLALPISGIFAFGEFRYWIAGQTVDAKVVHVVKPVRSEESDGVFDIRYSFADSRSKNLREEGDSVPASWGPPPPKLSVEYIPGRPGYSRILGNSSNAAIWIFAFCCVCVVAGIAYLYIDAKRALTPHRRRAVLSRKRKGRLRFPQDWRILLKRAIGR